MAFWEDRPQTIAVIPDALIFLTSGMNLALGLGYNYYYVTTHFMFSWFIGVVIGALLSAPLVRILLKRYFVLLSSFLVVVAGILYAVCSDEPTALIAARYLHGIGTGFITVPFIVHCSEISVPRKRGFCLGTEQFCTAVGIFIQATYEILWKESNGISPACVHGIFCLSFGLIALGLAFVVIESPIFFIRHANDAAAMQCLTYLQLPAVLSDEKKLLLDEHKNYVLKNEYLGTSGSFVCGLGPLLRMIFFCGVISFTFSLPYNRQLIIGTVFGMNTTLQWTSIVCTALRVLGALGAISMLDIIGRKLVNLIGLLVMAGLGIGVAVLFAYIGNWQNEYRMSMSCAFLIIIQFFAGLCAPTSTVYLGEAFPMLLKPYFIAFCICVQCVVHIIVICTFSWNLNSIYVYNTFTYAFLFACFLLFIFTIPETKLTTLSEAQERFHAWNHLRSW